jgi:hypothetical protein
MTKNQSEHSSQHDTMRTTELTSHAKVIDARERFIAPRPSTTSPSEATGNVISADFKDAYWKPGYCEPEKLHRAFVPFLKTLPFINMEAGGGPASYWNDTPTGKGRDDFKRGRDYAALTMAAIGAESCASWDLERIIEAIVIDAASRKAKGGKYSRNLPPAVYGFIHELSRQFCAKVTGSQP